MANDNEFFLAFSTHRACRRCGGAPRTPFAIGSEVYCAQCFVATTVGGDAARRRPGRARRRFVRAR